MNRWTMPALCAAAVIAILVGYAVRFHALEPTASELGVTWHEVPENPVLVGGTCFSWRCAGVTDPTIVQYADGNLAVWFTTIGISQASGGYIASGPYLGKAADSGLGQKLVLVREAPIVPVGPTGTWDRYVETPTVRDVSGTLTMWYLGYAAPGFVAPALGEMQAVDANGAKWIHPSQPIYRPSSGTWDAKLISGPTVVRGPDGIWRLYYTGIGGHGSSTTDGIGLLTSRDGAHWNVHPGNPVLQSEPGAWDDEILEQGTAYANGTYWLWYSGWRGELQTSTVISIGLATSSDGIHWTRYAKNPVIAPGVPGSWDDARVLAPDVIVEPDGSFLMGAYGQSRKDLEGRGSAGSIGFWRSP